MAYNTKAIKTDVNTKPIPQYYNPATDEYEALQGENGAARHVLYGSDGNPISTDFATQTTLAAILEKIIAAPATEAKQTALNALIGEVQAAPTANTLLARLKSLEDKIDKITAGTTPAVTTLSGRNAEITTLVNAYAVTEANAFVMIGGKDEVPISAALINKYREFDIYVVNTHDAAFRVSIAPYGMINMTPKVRMQDGTSTTYDTSAANVKACQHTILAGEYEFLSNIWPANNDTTPVKSVDPTPFKKYRGDLKLYLRSKTAPTTGSISVYLVGVIN